MTFDLGAGGSKFNHKIVWSPQGTGFGNTGSPLLSFAPVEDNRLGDNFVDLLAGVKVKLKEKSVLVGAVRVPVNNEGVRPTAVGTLAVELYF